MLFVNDIGLKLFYISYFSIEIELASKLEFEGSNTNNKLIDDDTNCPPVDVVIIL
jgi:hypothetical protein